MAIRIFSYESDFLAAVEAAGFTAFPLGDDCWEARDNRNNPVGHFTTEPGPVNLTDGVLAENTVEYFSYEG